ncbi:hypothetical protein HY486_02825 [Candidatus Woesearchaeota archaeon]|nr:hypothetical protein [Candidatus Woesearchaeota archaeon]
MVKIPLQDIIAKIKTSTGLDEETINQRISEKLIKLSGLVSKEGAAHILANELGVKLFESTGKVKDIYPGMKMNELIGKIVQVFETKEFAREDGTTGKLTSLIVGDETGTIRLVCWGSQAETAQKLVPGNIIKISDGIAKENRGAIEMHVSERTKMIINPQGVTVQEVKLPATTKKQIKELTETDQNVEIIGTVVQVFEPKFFEICPMCNSRLKPAESGWKCDTHGATAPDYGYVVNVFLDDGTESIRVALFRQHADKILRRQKQDILTYRTQPELYEPIKTELLGEQYRISGRTKNNLFFNRLEFVANTIEKAQPTEIIR